MTINISLKKKTYFNVGLEIVNLYSVLLTIKKQTNDQMLCPGCELYLSMQVSYHFVQRYMLC